MQDLRGKVAVITGGASGIGLAMARRFGQEGVKLMIADIQEDAIERSLSQLRSEGFEAVGCRTDVAKFQDVEALVRSTVAAFGKAPHRGQ